MGEWKMPQNRSRRHAAETFKCTIDGVDRPIALPVGIQFHNAHGIRVYELVGTRGGLSINMRGQIADQAGARTDKS